jgi:hypothetical protein
LRPPDDARDLTTLPRPHVACMCLASMFGRPSHAGEVMWHREIAPQARACSERRWRTRNALSSEPRLRERRLKTQPLLDLVAIELVFARRSLARKHGAAKVFLRPGYILT